MTSPAARSGDFDIVDRWGNHIEIVGELDRVVTIGAGFQKPGVQVRTGLTGRGRAIYARGAWHKQRPSSST